MAHFTLNRRAPSCITLVWYWFFLQRGQVFLFVNFSKAWRHAWRKGFHLKPYRSLLINNIFTSNVISVLFLKWNSVQFRLWSSFNQMLAPSSVNLFQKWFSTRTCMQRLQKPLKVKWRKGETLRVRLPCKQPAGSSYQQLWCAARTICYTNICRSVTKSRIFTTGWAAVYPKAMFLTTNGAHGSTNGSFNEWGKEARPRVGFLTLWNTCEQESSTCPPGESRVLG